MQTQGMAEAAVAQAIHEISLLSIVDLRNAFMAAFGSPAPPVKASAINKAVTGLTKPDALFQAWLLTAEPAMAASSASASLQFQHFHSYPDGTKAVLLIRNKEGLLVDLAAMTGPVTRSTPDTKANALQDILKAAAKCGIPQTRAEALARDGALEGAVKAAMTRQAVRAAFINGTWQSAALTAVFDVKLLFDGQFQQYLVRIGVGGLYGGAVGGLSSWISNPYLKNNIVLGVLIGSSFGLVGLASTGDWARFGKGLGVNIVSGAGGWGGATVGAFALAPFGPLGPPIGGFLGGMAGGWFGSRVAGQVPALSGVTDQEVRTMYEATVAQLAKAGLKPDPKLSARQVAEAMTLSGGRGGGAGDNGATGLPFNVCMTNAMANDVGDLRQSLLVMYEASPDQFTNFLARLRAANAELSPQTIH